jgi:glycosyltransferase involved in cell wall biosynthesis
MLHFPLHGAGAGVYARTLSEQLHVRGFDVRALRAARTPADDSFPGEAILFGSDGAHDLEFDFPVFFSHPCSHGPSFGELTADQRLRYERTLRTTVERSLLDFAPEIAHVHHGWLIASVLADLGVRFVVTLHGSESHAFEMFPAYRDAVCHGLAKAARVMAVSPAVAEGVTTYGLDPADITVVPSGVDLVRFKPLTAGREALLHKLGVRRPELPVVCFSGRLIAIKGVDTLLRALDRCRRDGLFVTTLIAGDGDEAHWLQEMNDALRLEDVYFLGQQPHAALPALYNAADVVVVPSREDALPLTALEAQACGTPVVASSVGALPLVVDEFSGLIVPPDDERALAQAIATLLAERRKRYHGTTIAARASAAFSFSRTADAVIDVYRRVWPGLLSEGAPAPSVAA